jgi:hypothetical protein
MGQMKDVDAKIGQSDYQSRQLAAALATLSLIFKRHPDVRREYTSYERDMAPPLYGVCDVANTMHWTFANPQAMGS